MLFKKKILILFSFVLLFGGCDSVSSWYNFIVPSSVDPWDVGEAFIDFGDTENRNQRFKVPIFPKWCSSDATCGLSGQCVKSTCLIKVDKHGNPVHADSKPNQSKKVNSCKIKRDCPSGYICNSTYNVCTKKVFTYSPPSK